MCTGCPHRLQALIVTKKFRSSPSIRVWGFYISFPLIPTFCGLEGGCIRKFPTSYSPALAPDPACACKRRTRSRTFTIVPAYHTRYSSWSIPPAKCIVHTDMAHRAGLHAPNGISPEIYSRNRTLTRTGGTFHHLHIIGGEKAQ